MVIARGTFLDPQGGHLRTVRFLWLRKGGGGGGPGPPRLAIAILRASLLKHYS